MGLNDVFAAELCVLENHVGMICEMMKGGDDQICWPFGPKRK